MKLIERTLYLDRLKRVRKFGGRMLVEHERDKIIEEIKELENDKQKSVE